MAKSLASDKVVLNDSMHHSGSQLMGLGLMLLKASQRGGGRGLFLRPPP